jgi:hypothetical protein|tara:strand:+ start:1676 stop:1777 length:102 start_codon:yes stop_codon:yes gene_type:complete
MKKITYKPKEKNIVKLKTFIEKVLPKQNVNKKI